MGPTPDDGLAPERPTLFTEHLQHRLPTYEYEPQASDLYRSGFIALGRSHDAGASREAEVVLSTWRSASIGGYDLYVHPDESVTLASDGERSVALIGAWIQYPSEDLQARLRSYLAEGGFDRLIADLEEAAGRFALIYNGDQGVCVVTDAFASRSVYYPAKDRFDGFSSHASLLATFLRVDPDPDTMTYIQSEYYQKRVVKYLPGIITAYGGDIISLLPNNYLRMRDRAQVRYWPRRPLVKTDVDEAAAAVSATVAGLARHLAARGVTPVLGITGGLDTRSMLSVLLKEGLKPEGVTWSGRYLNKRGEAEIARQVAVVAGIPHRFVFIDPERRQPHLFMGGLSKAVRLMLGPSRSPVGTMLTQKMRDHYPPPEPYAFLRGYGGEIIRGFYQKMATRITTVSSEQFAKAYASLETSPFTLAAFDHMISVGNYDERIQDLGYDLNDFFYWEHRMGTWGASMLSELDSGMYSMVGLNSRRAYDLAFGVPIEQRLSKQIMKAVIDRNWPELSTVEHL